VSNDEIDMFVESHTLLLNELSSDQLHELGLQLDDLLGLGSSGGMRLLSSRDDRCCRNTEQLNKSLLLVEQSLIRGDSATAGVKVETMRSLCLLVLDHNHGLQLGERADMCAAAGVVFEADDLYTASSAVETCGEGLGATRCAGL